MSMQTFFDVASPTTLASLIADIDAAGGTQTEREKRMPLYRDALQALIANVGNDEAETLVYAAYKQSAVNA